ncbi:MAG TPA: GMC oxidoreductase [Polyangiaceae bacterium]
MVRAHVRRSALLLSTLSAATAAMAAGCESRSEPAREVVATVSSRITAPPAYDADGCMGPGCEGGLTDGEFEYVIVGAGAGGGPLAARLAQFGHRVLLLEAGGDPGDKLAYQIPAWHFLASEDPSMRWDYFVNHYDDPAQAARDDKLARDATGAPKGIWYPRGSGLGGSTAVNAMITVTPHASDWDDIQATLGAEDPGASWSSDAMRAYFERLESNDYLPRGTPGHGFDGWLHTDVLLDNFVGYATAASDLKMLRAVGASILQTGRDLGTNLPFDPVRDTSSLLDYARADLNAPDPGRDGREGAFRLPQATRGGQRFGVREQVLGTIAGGYPLTLRTHALATRVTFDRTGARPKATGIEWIDGPNVYSASPLHDPSIAGAPHAIQVTREVIVSAGTFNTPQILELSGVGPAAELAQRGIAPVVDLPGVGKNLQDRYEASVVGQMSSAFGDQFSLLKSCRFDATMPPAELPAADPCYLLWKLGLGAYTINGSVVAVVRRSDPSLATPDLFIFGLPGLFRGYFPGYSAEIEATRTYFTWVVLKAHTQNNVGTVSLRSTDPRDRPQIDFRYFGDPATADSDLGAMVEGVSIARRIVQETRSLSPFTDDFTEVYPGTRVSTRDQVAQFVRDESWGHHACCTAKIGRADDPMAVLDGRFRVRGVDGLRVVDASVFPKIPGFFLALPIYMASEKAADVIHEDAAAR